MTIRVFEVAIVPVPKHLLWLFHKCGSGLKRSCCFSVYLVTNVPDSAVVLVDETIRDAWVKETVGPWPEACLRPWEPLVVGSALRHPEGRSEA